jgi:hypothetical protein
VACDRLWNCTAHGGRHWKVNEPLGIGFSYTKPSFLLGCAVAQAVSHWLPTAAAQVRIRTDMWGLWWAKRHWGRFSPSTSVSPANHSTNFSIIITRGWHDRPISGCSAKWTQLDWTPTIPVKEKKLLTKWRLCVIYAKNNRDCVIMIYSRRKY